MSVEETVPQLRERIDQQNKQIAGLKKERSELLSAAAEAQFSAAGYNPKHAKLFVSQAEEGTVPTADAVAAFASEWDLAKPSAAAVSEDTAGDADSTGGEQRDDAQSAPGSAALDALSRGGSSAGDGAGGTAPQKMTRAEYIQMTQTDKARADAALRQGLVELSGDTPVPQGTNPYDSSE